MDPRSRPPEEDPEGRPPALSIHQVDAEDGAPADVGRHTVEGERAIPSVNRARSLQSRIGSTMAIAVFAMVGAVFLYWYYSSTFAAQRHAEEVARKAREARAGGDVRPPRFARPEPLPSGPLEAAPPAGLMQASLPVPPPPPPPTPPYAPPPHAPVYSGGPKAKSPDELERERLLNAGVMLRAGSAVSAAGIPPGVLPPGTLFAQRPGADALAHGGQGAGSNAGSNSALAQSLRPTPTPAVRAQVLPDRRFLLPKGAFVDCTLETALDSTLPGLATCIAPVDIFSADGTVVLIERGTRFVGETRSDVRQGQSRIGVLWNEARTPQGVSVALASPGTDELGRTGLPGHVDRHFWERFGSAILISVIDGAIQAATTGGGSGNTGPTYNTGTARDVMTEVLRNTINIPPTVVKNQGERIQILVARDVDFRSVYVLNARE
jgi:type IV secretion system protein VirB10